MNQAQPRLNYGITYATKMFIPRFPKNATKLSHLLNIIYYHATERPRSIRTRVHL